MRKLIVSNFVTLDGYYEGKDKCFNSLFDYYHEDYSGDNSFNYFDRRTIAHSRFPAAKPDCILGQQWLLGRSGN